MASTKTKDGVTRITFGENAIPFFQDFAFWKPIPSDVAFTAERFNKGSFVLEGPGYGEKGNYGNGAIFVYRSRLPFNIDQMLMRITLKDAR